MAIIDFSGATLDFDASSASNIDHNMQVSFSGGHYSWKTNNGQNITALSSANDITANGTGPTGGTISAISAVGSGFEPIFSITGLDIPLTSLVDASNAANMKEKFWEAVLAGATTVVMPQLPSIDVSLSGDFQTVSAGQTVIGGHDVFSGTGVGGNHFLMGDAFTVQATAKLTGGNDQFSNVAGTLAGDAYDNAGNTVGGADSFTASSNPLTPTVAISLAIGDAYANTNIVTGGADTFTFTNIAGASIIAGDVYNHATGGVTGGNDKITLAKTDAFFLPMNLGFAVGDVYQANANVTGGNDNISIKDATGTAIAGDVYSAGGGTMTGGNDQITVASSAPFYAGPPAIMPPPPSFTYVVGDVLQQSAGNFTGGHDAMTIVNANAAGLFGDVYSANTATGLGGNDTISVTWNQVNIAASTFMIAGDFQIVSSGNFTGGNDTVTLNLTMGSDPTALLFGDGSSFGGNGNFTGGNDTIVLNSNRAGAVNFLVGDVQSVSTTGNFTGGSDKLTGSNGTDFIFGDGQSITAANYVGGNDFLDGRGGNDLLYGGKGIDYAVFSSLNQAVFVNLAGIAGSAAMPADWVEAIGQGFDQLFEIENVIGSGLGDTIIGDSFGNTFSGLGGDDKLNGAGGADVLYGGAGNDTLNGDAGADTMLGGAGNDVYYADNLGDIIDENIAGSDGIDMVRSANRGIDLNDAVHFKGAIENVQFTGAVALNAVGSTLANTLIGNSAANALNGMAGNDSLLGGLGNDTLAGGVGNDKFGFNTALNAATNKDTIVDFGNAAGNDDAFLLDNAIFAQLGAPGALNAAFFKLTTQAQDANDYLRYNPTNGNLSYDADGSGAGAAILFATLSNKAALTAADFVVI